MMKTCLRCKRLMPIGEFGPNARMPDKHHFYCRHCAMEAARAWATSEFEKKVRKMYGGHCVICDGVENLEIVATLEMKRRTPKAMVLICTACKRDGIPNMTSYRRNCSRCWHWWFARKQTAPTLVCPKCKSPYWHLPKI